MTLYENYIYCQQINTDIPFNLVGRSCVAIKYKKIGLVATTHPTKESIVLVICDSWQWQHGNLFYAWHETRIYCEQCWRRKSISVRLNGICSIDFKSKWWYKYGRIVVSTLQHSYDANGNIHRWIGQSWAQTVAIFTHKSRSIHLSGQTFSL